MLDPVTEAISHFIGYFHLGTEELRLRQTYDQFRHEKAKKDDLQIYSPGPTEETSFDLGGYNPDLNWKPKFKDDRFSSDPEKLSWPDHILIPSRADLGLDRPQEFLPPLPDITIDWVPPSPPSPPSPPDADPTLLPPSSVGTVTFQANALFDDDVFGDIEDSGFVLPESFAPQLDHLIAVSQVLSATKLPHPDGEDPWIGMTQALKGQIQLVAGGDAAENAAESVTVFTVTGAGASGILVNGQAVASMPTLADEMPAYFADRDEATESDLSDAFPDGYEAPAPQFSGHLVVTGANMLVNEVGVTSMWLDASVIVVAGNVTRIDAIDQVNVLSDHDNLGSQAATETQSVHLNAAQIDLNSAPASGGSADPLTTFPSNWAVTEIEGDLICYNWLSQTSYVSDHDRVVLTSTGSSTYISLGENEIFNTALIAELGYRFDMIVIGGDMYDISYIYQCNVLLDDDTVIGGYNASGSDNLLYNSASIQTMGVDSYGALNSSAEETLDAFAGGSAAMPSSLSQEELLQGIGTVRVLYISGDFVNMNVVEQRNVLGDNDQIELAAEAAILAADGDVEVVTGSNVLANTAVLLEFGVDSTVMAGGEIYTDALIHQAGFVNPDAAPTGVAQSGLVNEAVLFLADDMIDAPVGSADSGGPAPLPMDGGSLDVMQTVLA